MYVCVEDPLAFRGGCRVGGCLRIFQIAPRYTRTKQEHAGSRATIDNCRTWLLACKPL